MKFTKYEVARIIGARALQLSMGAPFLMKRPKDVFDALVLARTEYEQGLLPITIKRPKPIKLEYGPSETIAMDDDEGETEENDDDEE